MLQNKLANWQEKQYFLNYIFSDFDFFIPEKTNNCQLRIKILNHTNLLVTSNQHAHFFSLFLSFKGSSPPLIIPAKFHLGA